MTPDNKIKRMKKAEAEAIAKGYTAGDVAHNLSPVIGGLVMALARGGTLDADEMGNALKKLHAAVGSEIAWLARARVDQMLKDYDSGPIGEFDLPLMPPGTGTEGLLAEIGALNAGPKKMSKYVFGVEEPGLSMGKYESNPMECRPGEAEHWVLHLNIPDDLVQTVLGRAAALPYTTGEYEHGDSWIEWGEEAKEGEDKHLAIYFKSEPHLALLMGEHLRRHCEGAQKSIPLPPEAYAISTAGDFAEQIRD